MMMKIGKWLSNILNIRFPFYNWTAGMTRSEVNRLLYDNGYSGYFVSMDDNGNPALYESDR